MTTQTNSNGETSVLITVPADLDDAYQEIDKFVTEMYQIDYASKWGSYDYGLIMKAKYYEGVIDAMISEIEKRSGSQDIISLFRGWVDDMVQAYQDGRNDEYVNKIPHPDIGRHTELCMFLMNARQCVDNIYMCMTPLIHLDEIYTGGYPYEPKLTRGRRSRKH